MMWRILLPCAALLNHPGLGSSTNPNLKQLPTPLPRCMSPEDLMTNSYKDIIIDIFNFERTLAAKVKDPAKYPVAYPMSVLVWDSVLADNAKKVAMTCPLVPLVAFAIIKMANQSVGQSIALKVWDRKPPNEFAIDELLVRYSSSIGNMPATKVTSLIHNYESGYWDAAFQILWNDTKKVGCSYVSYINNDSQSLQEIYMDTLLDTRPVTSEMYFKVLVCHFSPAGCIPRQQVYRVKIEPSPPISTTTTRKPLNHSIRLETLSPFCMLTVHLLNILFYVCNIFQ